MCRFAIYLGEPIILNDFVVKPSHSIIYQSFDSLERGNKSPLNGDGFGIAWYEPHVNKCPGVYRSVTPAWSNKNLSNMCRAIKSGCVVTHIRAASSGLSVEESNCHPFTYKSISLVHNGRIGGFKDIKKQIIHDLSDKAFQTIAGSTDSEYLFAMFLDRYWQKKPSKHPLTIADALQDTIGAILKYTENSKEDSFLNVGITNGEQIVATRFSTSDKSETLYYCEKVDVPQGPTKKGRQVQADDLEKVVSQGSIIASEPLADHDIWHEIAHNSLMQIKQKELHKCGVSEHIRKLDV